MFDTANLFTSKFIFSYALFTSLLLILFSPKLNSERLPLKAMLGYLPLALGLALPMAAYKVIRPSTKKRLEQLFS